MYRPQITVVDCTIRDGGLMNKSQFTLDCVQAVYKAICESGIHIVELGYRNSRTMFDPEKYGAWRFCDDEMIKKVVGDNKFPDTKIAVMMDAHKSSVDDLLPRDKSHVDVIRCATYVKDIDKCIKIVNDAVAKGYETTINIMSISTAPERELNEALQQIHEETKIKACYIVDSFGNLYSEDIDYFVSKYQKMLPGIEVGVHMHNNQQLAFANTIEGIIRGANYLDGTLYGLGRGAGNCCLELLLGFLKNPKFNMRPILDVIASHIIPLQKEITWGYSVPYMVTGIMNRHPDEAIKLMMLPEKDPARYNFGAFYERMLDPEP
ncbi:MAG: aldolase catalytic domain-containing protein [Bacteroidota bacterium]|jgi:4-hydroxy 2-oxovalerate aldolase